MNYLGILLILYCVFCLVWAIPEMIWQRKIHKKYGSLKIRYPVEVPDAIWDAYLEEER